MRVSVAFETVIEPSLERIPLIETLHVERHDGRDFIVSHIIRRNVFTAFDTKLSRHLAAVQGKGFPAVSVEVRLRERADGAAWRPSQPTDHPTVPHALAAVARRALGTGVAATMRLHYEGFKAPKGRGPGAKRILRVEDVDVLEQALAACRQFGEPSFLDISGDFDLVRVRPIGDELPPVMMDLYDRRIAIPAIGGGGDVISAPLYDFERVLGENADVRAYLATTRHSLVAQKEAAVHAFRAAAEDRILGFDRALAGRDLAFHRLDAVISLVARLKAGLGDDLKGISEDARLRALDWAEAIEDANAQRPQPAASQWPAVTMHPGSRVRTASGTL